MIIFIKWAVGVIALYLLISFVAKDLDFRNWEDIGRFLFACVVGITGAILFSLTHKNKP